MDDAIRSALAILDYGAEEGPWDKEAAAVRALIEDNAKLRVERAELWDKLGEVMAAWNELQVAVAEALKS